MNKNGDTVHPCLTPDTMSQNSCIHVSTAAGLLYNALNICIHIVFVFIHYVLHVNTNFHTERQHSRRDTCLGKLKFADDPSTVIPVSYCNNHALN